MTNTLEFFDIDKKPIPVLKKDSRILVLLHNKDIYNVYYRDKKVYYVSSWGLVPPDEIKAWALPFGVSFETITKPKSKPLSSRQLEAQRKKQEREADAIDMVESVIDSINEIIKFKADCTTQLFAKYKALKNSCHPIKKVDADIYKAIISFIDHPEDGNVDLTCLSKFDGDNADDDCDRYESLDLLDFTDYLSRIRAFSNCT